MNWKIFGVKWKMILEDFGRIEKVSKNQEVLGKLRRGFKTLREILGELEELGKNFGKFFGDFRKF